LNQIDTILAHTSHLARVRSVAKAAGFCAYYARMAEKMGVFEVQESPNFGRGRDVHRILGLASLYMFAENPKPSLRNVGEYIEKAVRELDVNVDEDKRKIATTLLRKLVSKLPHIKQLLGLSEEDPLFPIVEQQFMSFKDRMYGAPDLILENIEKGKAIVVEWKSYPLRKDSKSKSSSSNDYEIAQVIAYSILEARRLGLNKYDEIFKAIAGMSIREFNELSKQYGRADINRGKLLSKILREFHKNLKILPVIIGPTSSYPPHPLLYARGKADLDMIIKRLRRMYRLFRGIILAAEFLTLQVTNVNDALIRSQAGIDSSILKDLCKARRGNYPVYSYTPFKYLRSGRPGQWDRYPCRVCGFKGDGGPCDFYFGPTRSKDKDYFDKLMWWARYNVYSKRERDLVNYRAMDILLRWLSRTHDSDGLVKTLSDSGEYEVDISGGTPPIRIRKRGKTIPNVVSVREGGKEIATFRFDIFKVQDVTVSAIEIELRRPLRKLEEEESKIGSLRKSVALSILDLRHRVISPVLSINTFVMLNDYELEDNTVVYYGSVPSNILQHSFKLFSHYVNLYKSRNANNSIIIAFEAPVDLTLMELRAIDSLHRFIKSIKMGQEIPGSKTEEAVEPDEVKREVELIEKYIPRHEDFTRGTLLEELAKILKEKILPR